MKRSNEQEYLDSYVKDWLANQLDEREVTIKMIEVTRQRLQPLEHLLKAIETFARTPGLPPRAVTGFEVALRETIDGAALSYQEIHAHALLVLGRELLEPISEGSKALKPIGFIKKDYNWVSPKEKP